MLQLIFEPLSLKNWSLFEALMGERGGCGGCWCMTHRLKKSDYEKNKYAGNKKLLKQLIKNNLPVGLLAIHEKEAIGWLSLAPREQFIRLNDSRIYKPVDDNKVWSITCFLIKKEFRNQGLSRVMIEAAKTFAKNNQIEMLEAYPVKPYSDKIPDAFAWTGFFSTFKKAGFKVVSEVSKTKPMMRFTI